MKNQYGIYGITLATFLMVGCGDGFKSHTASRAQGAGLKDRLSPAPSQTETETPAQPTTPTAPSAPTTPTPPTTPPTTTPPTQTTLPSDCGTLVGKLLGVSQDLSTSVSALKGAAGTLVIEKAISQNASLTLPDNVKLCFGASGSLNVASGKEVRIPDLSVITLRKIFTGEGRVLFKNSKERYLYPHWFGAVGDGVTDDASAFRKVLDAVSESTGGVIYLRGQTYALTLDPGLILPEGNGIEGAYGTILARLTGQDGYGYMSNKRHLFSLRSKTFIRNLTLDNIPMPRNSYTVYRHTIMVGEYETGRGYKDVTLEGLVLKGGVEGEIGINIWGDSSNIKIRNIKFPRNSGMSNAISVQWGWDTRTIYDANGNLRKDWTGHPHDVLIENIEIEALTLKGVSSDGQPIDFERSNCFDLCGNWGIWLSAAYNVTIRNVYMGEVANGVVAYAGDFGAYMADAAVKPLVGTGIVMENVTINSAFLRGFWISGLPNYIGGGASFSGDIDYVDMPVTIKKSRATGVGYAGRLLTPGYPAGQGLLTHHTNGVRVEDVDFSYFAYGAEVFENVKNLQIVDSNFDYLSLGGISLIGGASQPSGNILIRNTAIMDANTTMTVAPDTAAISIGANTYGVQVESCHIGARSAYRQYYGVYIQGGSGHYVWNNWVSSVAPGGGAFGTAPGVTSTWYIRNNGADPGIPVYFGNTPTYF